MEINMNNHVPRNATSLTPEQCQRLGQIYNLILSWRSDVDEELPSKSTKVTAQNDEPIFLEVTDKKREFRA